MSDAGEIRYAERDVPLTGIDETVREVVALFGGEVESRDGDAVELRVPKKRGVAAAGDVRATISWAAGEAAEAGRGVVTIAADAEVDVNRGKRIALLAAGAFGAGIFLLWPFFPALGAAAWIGGLIALAVYLLALRTTQSGLVWTLLQQIADLQEEREDARQAELSGDGDDGAE